MDRRHQVFVSSTFSDLKQERAEITQALLELDCFPAGMELFPATSASAWELIKGVIDDSDYYCLVMGGRYGSVDEKGIGYTEKEYDYAVSVCKPVMAFLHKAPGAILADNTERTDVGRQKLELFRAKVEAAHHCKYWASAEELGGQVSRSLVVLRRTMPSDGWVPGKFAVDESVLLENATLKARVSQLEAELLVSLKKLVPEPAVDFARGNDEYCPNISFKLKGKNDYIFESITVTWDTILSYVGPSLLGECTDEEFLDKLSLCFFHSISDVKEWKTVDHGSIVIPIVIRDEIKVQLRALGQVGPGIKRRAVSDQKVYWRLTEEGEARLIRIQAVKRKVGLTAPSTELAGSAMTSSQSLTGVTTIAD